ncbi:MAG: hypothetical protein EBS22_01055 [Acidimicrobiia bacterium]|nr:hypothetical protein [Acidimicrobiia bacterium]
MHELFALFHHPAGLSQLVGQPTECAFQQFDDLVAIDSRGGRQRHVGSRRDDVDGAPEQNARVTHDVVGSTVVGAGVVVEVVEIHGHRETLSLIVTLDDPIAVEG